MTDAMRKKSGQPDAQTPLQNILQKQRLFLLRNAGNGKERKQFLVVFCGIAFRLRSTGAKPTRAHQSRPLRSAGLAVPLVPRGNLRLASSLSMSSNRAASS